MSWSFERLAGPYTLTEGPAWDGSGLLFSDIMNDRIMRYDPGTKRVDVFRTGTEGGNGLMFDQEGRLYGCQQWARRIVRYESLITALIGGVLGLLIGLLLGAMTTVALADQCFTLQIPVLYLIAFLVLAAIAGVLAAIPPARRASRLDVLEALAYE